MAASHDSATSYADATKRVILREQFCISETCAQCAAGTYLNSVTLTCMDCPAGKYIQYANKLNSCYDCGVGKYYAGTASTAFSNCVQCPEGKVSDAVAGTSEATCQVSEAQGFDARSEARRQTT